MTALECRSQAQALDWSLVLISQGIESVPRRCEEEDGAWVLEIADADLPQAKESIAAYERENATAWRRELKWTGLLFDARAVIWFTALALFHFFATASSTDFEAVGVAARVKVLHGEWWRVFTAMTLHADVAHLAANATTGIVFLGLAMGCFGIGNALLLSFLGGAIGNVITIALHEDGFGNVGASGMVMASLGLLVAHSLFLSRHEKRLIWIGRGVIGGSLLVVFWGLSPRSDVIAHVAGFVAGAGLGISALRFRQVLARRSLNVAALTLCCVLIAVAWALALR